MNEPTCKGAPHQPHSHADFTMPLHGMEPDVAGNEGGIQEMGPLRLLIRIASKQLIKTKKIDKLFYDGFRGYYT